MGGLPQLLGGSRFDKHGFVLIGVLIPGDFELSLIEVQA
ncbi:hypothetical protein HMPREF0299_5749 [Corynebacterium matruchotii ATCC 14266]|uniref:Uncharacterized protein n=1 Tax=Corynebacterium matruchotii ATCC 14266 TaxID=553207 RepID=E0DBR2_9CORY|nr:hypothetical protein HMPREF0299_5749 [Corynebacterium matruchotii ATCC 14266]